jgi:transglutaminase-like putative cysteine protease
LLWNVLHTTRYDYSAPVFLEPHILRLTPATDATQRLMSLRIDVTPSTTARSDNVDHEGNHVTHVWFEGETHLFGIEAETTVETLRANPFDYLWQGPDALPLEYPDEAAEALSPYRRALENGAVRSLSEDVAQEVFGDPQAFPLGLAKAVHATCEQIIREEGDPRPAAETLQRGEGSCRDLALVFLEASRLQGYAARFVSGYIADEENDRHELHAWVELYIPGGGWRGFDPTIGLAVADRHIVLARSSRPSQAAPLSGSFRGKATSRLTTDVRIRRL